MDELAQFNKARWEALSQANILYSRPMLNLNVESAKQVVDSQGIMGDVSGKEVLCLASGGGQQSAAFALLGAHVTVFDLSETQLDRDRSALAHYGLTARIEQGDMRDLSRFGSQAFDIVWQAFSINFVPDAGAVFDQVRAVLRPGGLYHIDFHNPFTVTVSDSGWNGDSYPVRQPYREGEIHFESEHWDVEDIDGTTRSVQGPREFNHRLSTLINGLIVRGFAILGFWEDISGDPTAEPGSWEHYKAYAPPYCTLWARYQP
jgi:SAM-dependent methyltransferase